MKTKWYENDYFVIGVFIFTLIVGVIANMCLHNGHLAW